MIPRYGGYAKNSEKGQEMIAKVKARFSDGVLTPLEPLNLEEGKEVTVSIEDTPPPDRTIRALRATAGAWRGSHDPEDLKQMLYEARLTGSREAPNL
jgi:predicted DNA-binding antitoxin AbrB/MazE fold protein